MLAKTYGAAVMGVDAHVVTIEVSIVQGIRLFMSGLPDKAVKESEHRVQAALSAGGYYMPRSRVIINLAPADMRKAGSAYDLPLALGILCASRQLRLSLESRIIVGELSLNGDLLPIRGALSIAQEASKHAYRELILPASNACEAAVVGGIDVIGVSSLEEAIAHIKGSGRIPPTPRSTIVEDHLQLPPGMDFMDVQGQANIKRALEIAAAGGHNVLLIGPPGAGKTMLARRFPTILPALTSEEAIETTKIHSVAGKLAADSGLMTVRPFRAPHHTSSDVSLIGGGAYPMPGEICLAHHGVLFLDELPEFRRSVLEVLRQPMEERKVTISRARISLDYPANFMLVASMNPCPCGFYNHPEKPCSCPPGSVRRYLAKISGPLLDRIDLHVEVTPVPIKSLVERKPEEGSAVIRNRVASARKQQLHRYGSSSKINASMTSRDFGSFCSLNNAGSNLLGQAMKRLGLSARAYDRIIRVARTIADLAGSERIETAHLAEAIQFRSLDRESWGG